MTDKHYLDIKEKEYQIIPFGSEYSVNCTENVDCTGDLYKTIRVRCFVGVNQSFTPFPAIIDTGAPISVFPTKYDGLIDFKVIDCPRKFKNTFEKIKGITDPKNGEGADCEFGLINFSLYRNRKDPKPMYNFENIPVKLDKSGKVRKITLGFMGFLEKYKLTIDKNDEAYLTGKMDKVVDENHY